MKTLLLLFLSCFIIAYSIGQSIIDPYTFPVKPGTESWKRFQSGAEMTAACQVPSDILKKLTTVALVKTCLTYPLFSQVYTRSNTLEGFEALKKSFNGFQELLIRRNAGQYLLSHYVSLNAGGYNKNWTLERKGEFIFEITKTELLLAQSEIISSLNKEETNRLLAETHKKYEEKRLNEIYGRSSLKNSALVMGRVLDYLGILHPAKTPQMDDFIKSGTTTDIQVPDEINRIAKSYLK